jgi:hypothetical protein
MHNCTNFLLSIVLLLLPLHLQVVGFPGKGSGTVDDPYQISNVLELDSVRNHLDAHFILMNDLDFAGSKYDSANSLNNQGWISIGYYDFPLDVHRFKGTFDGSGHVIKNLYIDQMDDYDRNEDYGNALFGSIDSAVIKNLGITSCKIRGNGRNTASLVVGADSSTIDNCYSTGSIYGKGCTSLGGLVASISACTISNSFSACSVFTDSVNRYIGGFMGGCSHSEVISCYSVAHISGDAHYDNEACGGLIGGVTDSRISKCYFSGSLILPQSWVGGIAGHNDEGGIVEQCYVSGLVAGLDEIGGIVGHNGSDNFNLGTINNCYMTGVIQGLAGGDGSDYIGGIIGGNPYGSVSRSYSAATFIFFHNAKGSHVGGIAGASNIDHVSYCYCDTLKGGIKSSNLFARNTTQMKQQQTYVGFNFDTDWAIDPAINDGYPFLQWQLKTHTPIQYTIKQKQNFNTIKILNNNVNLPSFIEFNNDRKQPLELEIFDCTGRKVASANYGNILKLNRISSSVYIVVVKSGNKRIAKMVGVAN